LEELFDCNDVAKKPKIEPTWEAVEEHNIGSEKYPQMIKLSKSLPIVEKQKHISLLKEFSDVFAWCYEDLETYETKIIQHKFPIKRDQKPFKKNFEE